MVGFQFAHISTFSRKGNSVGRTVAQVAGEAARLEGHAPHVDQPQPPTVLDGVNPAELPAEIERRAAGARKALRGKGRGVSIRQDTHVLDGVVLSHPFLCADIAADPELRRDYEAWRTDAVNWLKTDAQRRSVEVLSIVEHLDEAHPHIHALGIPLNARLDAKQAHPGYAAQAQAAAEGKNAVDGNRSYRAAMTEWQNRYHAEVAIKHGQARVGPQRRRLTRAQWKAEQAEAERTAQRLEQIAADQAKADDLAQHADKAVELANAQAAQIIREATARAAQLVDQADRKAEAIAAGVEAWADGRLIGPGQETSRDKAPLIFDVPESEKKRLIAKIEPAKEWLHAWTGRMNKRLEGMLETSKLAQELRRYLPAAQQQQATALAAQVKRRPVKEHQGTSM